MPGTTEPTVTRRMAEWAASVRYEELPADVVLACKRFLTDSVGCALGGLRQHDARVALDVLDEVAGVGPATVIGSGRRLDPVSAALANSLLIRVMDYNDIYWKQDPCHPSDLIPAALAAVERQRGSGRELMVGIAIAYEFAQRLSEASTPGIREVGWHHATLTAIAAPIVAGRMLGLNAEKIANAIGIAASTRATAGAVTAGRLTMMKNTADPLAVESGVLAALLAERGFTGPEHVLDGKEGLGQVLGTDWRWDVLTDGLGEHWRILQCGMKSFPAEALTHAPISATLDLVREHELTPDDVSEVRVRALSRAADILADPSKYDPRTKETADHSLPYVVAAALVDRKVTPEQFEIARILDPTIRAQLPKIKVTADPEIDAAFPALQRTVVTIVTADGRELTRQLDYPKGDPRNPMTDVELQEKFDALAGPICSSERLQKMKAALRDADRAPDVSTLLAELKADRLGALGALV